MKKKLALLGGDLREAVAGNVLGAAGYKIKSFGLPGEELTYPVEVVGDIEGALAGAEAVVLPVRGVEEEGWLYAPFLKDRVKVTPEILKSAAGADIYVGICSRYLEAVAAAAGCRVVPVMELDTVAVPNAVPTAEGALGVAIEKSPYGVAGAMVVVLGYGRVGKAVAAVFRAVGAEVEVVTRNEEEVGAALALGYRVRGYAGLKRVLPRARVVVNTVPGMVLPGRELDYVGRGAIIIDLASAPGGVDFAGAEARGIPAYLCPGLPGKVAPITAGEIYGKGIMELVEGEGK